MFQDQEVRGVSTSSCKYITYIQSIIIDSKFSDYFMRDF